MTSHTSPTNTSTSARPVCRACLTWPTGRDLTLTIDGFTPQDYFTAYLNKTFVDLPTTPTAGLGQVVRRDRVYGFLSHAVITNHRFFGDGFSDEWCER